MARQSVQHRRKAQILDAYERCIIKYGVEGAVLQKIADEAGLARPLIRHHVGNREELLEELVERFILEGDSVTQMQLRELPDKQRVVALIDLVFSEELQFSINAALLYQSLLQASQTRPGLRVKLEQWNNDYVDIIRHELHRDYPQASEQALDEVALGFVALYSGLDSFTGADAGSMHSMSKRVALRLLDSLHP
jgi:AcrR family transcriptional regulator